MTLSGIIWVENDIPPTILGPIRSMVPGFEEVSAASIMKRWEGLNLLISPVNSRGPWRQGIPYIFMVGFKDYFSRYHACYVVAPSSGTHAEYRQPFNAF